ncbi:MAG: DUF6519 domain-containing protein [Acidobacteriota bacterium]
MRGDFSRFLTELARQYQGVYQQQGRVDLDADTNAAAVLEENLRRHVVRDLLGPAGAPEGAAGFAIEVGEPPGGGDETLLIGAGRYWVDGILCRNLRTTTLSGQPYLPGYEGAVEDGSYEIFLDVWERSVNGFQDPRLLDPALEGVDTTVRKQAVWQVRVGLESGDSGESSLPPGVLRSNGLMKARCLEGNVPGNRLYRIQIHYPQIPMQSGDGPAPPPPSFKWSRDNGSQVAAVEDWTSSGSGAGRLVTVKVRTFGSPLESVFQPLDWVEFLNDAIELDPQALPLWQVQEIQPDRSTVTLVPSNVEASDPVIDASLHPMLLRWDQQLTEEGTFVDGTEIIRFNEWMDLEDGIQVFFDGSESQGPPPVGPVVPRIYQIGDAWAFDSRTAIAGIQWPQTVHGEPLPMPKHGPHHVYAPLATASYSGGSWSAVNDLRTIFQPLTGGSGGSSSVDAKGLIPPPPPRDASRWRRLEERVQELEEQIARLLGPSRSMEE